MIDVTLPLRLVSLSNQREHWAKRAKRAKAHRAITSLRFKVPHNAQAFRGPLVITLTRIGKRKLDDDNLRGACKSVRDGVADFLGVNDADPRIEWKYEQEKGEYAVRIRIESQNERTKP